MTAFIFFMFFLLPLVFLFLVYTVVASISHVVRHIAFLLFSLIYVVTVYSAVTSGCLEAEIENGTKIDCHCLDILWKYLSATLGTLFELILLIRVIARCKSTEDPNQAPSAPDNHQQCSIFSIDAFVSDIPELMSVPQTQIKTVRNAASTTVGQPPSYWAVVSAGKVDYSQSETKSHGQGA